jgi:hypothetical protein
MPLDPKQIEEWKATIAAGNVIYPSAHGAIVALLSEREEMLARLRDLRDGIGAAMGAVMEGDVYSVAVHLRRLADDDRLAAFLR